MIIPPVPPTYTLLWSQANESLDSGMSNDCGADNAGLGQYWQTGYTAIIGHVVNKVIVNLKKSGTPTGTFNCYVVKADGSLITIGSMSASTITTSYVSYEFVNNTNAVSMATNDAVGFNYSGTDGVIYVRLWLDTGPEANTGVNYICPVSATAWGQLSSYQLKIEGVYEKD